MSHAQSVETFSSVDIALKAVQAALKTGETVVPDIVAHRLLIEHPYCDVALADLSQEISRQAVAYGLAVELGHGSAF